jgi:hypothetical protein
MLSAINALYHAIIIYVYSSLLNIYNVVFIIWDTETKYKVKIFYDNCNTRKLKSFITFVNIYLFDNKIIRRFSYRHYLELTDDLKNLRKIALKINDFKSNLEKDGNDF